MCWASGAQRDKYKAVLLLRKLGRARKQIIECEHLIAVTWDRHTCIVDSENLKQIFPGKGGCILLSGDILHDFTW